jgi:hypothetical protein
LKEERDLRHRRKVEKNRETVEVLTGYMAANKRGEKKCSFFFSVHNKAQASQVNLILNSEVHKRASRDRYEKDMRDFAEYA